MRYYSRKFVKESQTIQRSEKQRWFTPELRGERRGGPFVIMKPDWQTFVVAASDHNKCKNSFDHSSHFTGVTQWPPPTPSPLVTEKPQVSGGTRQKTSWRKVYNPSTGHNERGRGRRETWPHKNSVYANPSPLAFNYLGELMNSNGTIYAATTKLETFER